MTFEEFEKAKPEELRASAKACFDRINEVGESWGGSPTLLLQAQFYLAEIDRRGGRWIATRDLILEIVVILLIGGEIVLALKQGRDEGLLMDKQNGILANLQTSTSETATAMKGFAAISKAMGDSTSASAKTLLSLRTTTETMNRGIHDQLDLFYDPSVDISFDTATKRMMLSNRGRTSITITKVTIQDSTQQLDSPRMVAGSGQHYFDLTPLYNLLSTSIPKGGSQSIPVKVTFKNEQAKQYVLDSVLFCMWDKDSLNVYAHNSPLTRKP